MFTSRPRISTARTRRHQTLAVLLAVAFISQTAVAFAPAAALATTADDSAPTVTHAPSVADEANLTPTPNPSLPHACGLDLGLVIDSSGSISPTELTQMKNAFTGFVDALLPGTPTQMSVVEFDTDVVGPTLGFTNDTSAITNRIAAATSGGFTNWEAALVAAHGTYDPRPAKPDLILFASDGNPNTTGTGGSADGGAAGEDAAVNAAVSAANAIKADGIRLIALGIGDDLNIANLMAITGSNINDGATSDVITTSFADLADDLAGLADDLCGGKILVQKQLDTNGDGEPDLDGTTAEHRLAGWTFDVSGAPSDPDVQTTTDTGALEFSVTNGAYAVTETAAQPNTELASASCRKGSSPIGTFDIATRTISGLTLTTDETIICTFLNQMRRGSLRVIKQVIGGTAAPSDWQMHVRLLGFDLPGSPQPGSATGTDYLLPAGTYTVSEAGGPEGYRLTYGGDCDSEGQVIMDLGQDATCVLTNTLPVPPDLTVTKTDGLTTAAVGQELTYTIVVQNAEGDPATGVTASDTLPPQATYVNATRDGADAPATVTPDAAGDVLAWSLGTLAGGASTTLLVTVRLDSLFPAGTTTLTNRVQVQTSSAESDTTNNSATDATAVTAGPTLGLQKSAAPNPVPAGQTVRYTVSWSVGGTSQATGVVLTDPVPANTSFVSSEDGGSHNAGTNTVTWNLGVQSPGASGQVHFTVRAASPIANGTIVANTASIDSAETDPAVTASASVTVTSAPQLTIDKTSNVSPFANPGQTVSYTIVVTNATTATDTARAVVVTDTLPQGLTFTDGSTTKTTIVGDLTPGQSHTITLDAVVGSTATAGTYTNTATAKGSNTTAVSDTADLAVQVPAVLAAQVEPALAITKTALKSTVNRGQTVRYSVEVKNIGQATAVNVTVTDRLPARFTFASDGTKTKTFAVGTLEPGQTFLLSYEAKVSSTARAGRHVNVATADADNAPPVSDDATVTVRTVTVLAETGARPSDRLLVILGPLLLAAGLTVLTNLRRRRMAW